MIGLFNESAYGQMKLSNLKLGLYAQNLKIIVSNSPLAYMPSEPHGEGDIAVELWKKLEPGEK